VRAACTVAALAVTACGAAEPGTARNATLTTGERVYEVRTTLDPASLRFVLVEPIAAPGPEGPRRRHPAGLSGSTVSPIHEVVELPPLPPRTFTLLSPEPCVLRSSISVAIASGNVHHGSSAEPMLGAWARAHTVDATPCRPTAHQARLALAGDRPGVSARLWGSRVLSRDAARAGGDATVLVAEELALLDAPGVAAVQVWQVPVAPDADPWPWTMYRSWSAEHPVGRARLRRGETLVREIDQARIDVAGFLLEGERVLLIERSRADPPGWRLAPLP
jgi:hypothetical protein